MLLGALGVAALVPASASGALIGPRDIDNSMRTGTYSLNSCTYGTVKHPDAKVRSPIGGEIKRWRVNIPEVQGIFVNDGPVRLQVLKRTENQPGVVNDEFKVVRESEDQTVTPDFVQAFFTNLRIRKGQFIGLAGASDTTVAAGTATGAYHLQWCPTLMPGAPGAHSTFAVGDDYLLYNATVRK